MDIGFITPSIAVLNSGTINTVQDAIDLIGNAYYQGAASIILEQSQLHDHFFKLSTGFAGEVLQKFSNYGFKLAIVGSFSTVASNSLKDFIRESNAVGFINFVEDRAQALEALSR